MKRVYKSASIGSELYFIKSYLISLSPLPDAWGLHTKEGKWISADNNQPNHQQLEHRQEGSNVSEEIEKTMLLKFLDTTT